MSRMAAGFWPLGVRGTKGSARLSPVAPAKPPGKPGALRALGCRAPDPALHPWGVIFWK